MRGKRDLDTQLAKLNGVIREEGRVILNLPVTLVGGSTGQALPHRDEFWAEPTATGRLSNIRRAYMKALRRWPTENLRIIP